MLHKKPRILVVGSFVMDVIAATEKVPGSGQTVYGKSFHMAPGGKGANQALQCARLGADVTMVETTCSASSCWSPSRLPAWTSAMWWCTPASIPVWAT